MISLTCQSEYSGKNKPMLTWFRDGEETDSVDMQEIRLVKYGITTKSRHADNQVTYTCRMAFGDLAVHECSLKLDITCKNPVLLFVSCSSVMLMRPVSFTSSRT